MSPAMKTSLNYAAYQLGPGQPLSLQEAPYTPPAAHQVVIKASAWAVNPADHLLQSSSPSPWLRYPVLPGADVAGTVHAIGPGVTALQPGDRVCALAIGAPLNQPCEGAFQLYVVVHEALTARIPTSMHADEAVVLPLYVATAAAGLFQGDMLGLRLPRAADPSAAKLKTRVNGKVPAKTLVVWGGASGVGCHAIQLAVAAGYGVIATAAAAADAALVQSLGAVAVFDETSPGIVDEVVDAVNKLRGTCAGIFQAAGSVAACLEVAARANGDICVATATPVPEDKPADVKAKMAFALTIRNNEVGRAVFGQFLPEALERGSYRVVPQPVVVGTGLEALQGAMEVLRRVPGTRKVVVGTE